jgi:adenylate cyclase
MPVNRKLVAVVVADVVGYSRLMERDEAGTHQRLRALRDELVDAKIAAHGGRIVKTSGDGFLLEFASATAALRCAVEVQREMGVRNLYVAPDEKIEFRIGINLGDIIVEGDDILGDGVNVAARLETLAEPGGICVASAIWEQVHEDLGIEFVDSGEQRVKNISKPIRVFRVGLGKGVRPQGESAAIAATAAAAPAVTSSLRRPSAKRAAIAAAVVLAGVVAGTWYALRPAAPSAATAAGGPPLRSVMILPFAVIAGDAALDAAATRITGEVTRALGDSIPDVRVASASLAASLAGKSADPRAVGREANVRYVVEGELRPVGKQVAVTLRLVDALDGSQVQTERRTVDAAALGEPDAVRQYTSAIRVILYDAIGRTAAAAGGKGPTTAQDLVVRALAVSDADPIAAAREVRRLADEAIRLDPNFAGAWAQRAGAELDLFGFDFTVDRERVLADADADSLKAVTLDPRDAVAWTIRSLALAYRGSFDAAFAANDRARTADPSRYFPDIMRIWLYVIAGKPADALKTFDAVQGSQATLDPQIYSAACSAHLLLGAYAAAIAQCERAAAGAANWYIFAHQAAAYALAGDADKAAQAKARLLKTEPMFTIARYEAKRLSTAPEKLEQDKKYFLAGLRKAGVPE